MMKTINIILALSLAILVSCSGGDDGGGDNGSSDPARAFGPGTYIIGRDIGAGRFFSDPRSGCYWERLSGLGGTLDDILANQFLGFDALQEIVDIRGNDHAFKATADCGNWFTTPRHGMQNAIPPGNWLIGSQVAPGTYRVDAGSGCYWERLRGFSGELRPDLIANNFIGSASPQAVSIAASDVGFFTNGKCGTWTRVENRDSLKMIMPVQSLEEMESNWRAYQQHLEDTQTNVPQQ
jgi:hypothetical protein